MLNQLTLTEAQTKLRSQEITSTDLTKACLSQISASNDDYNAFLSTDTEGALAAAANADQVFRSGAIPDDAPLLGIPLALKDNMAVKGAPLTCASKLLENFISPYAVSYTHLTLPTTPYV